MHFIIHRCAQVSQQASMCREAAAWWGHHFGKTEKTNWRAFLEALQLELKQNLSADAIDALTERCFFIDKGGKLLIYSTRLTRFSV